MWETYGVVKRKGICTPRLWHESMGMLYQEGERRGFWACFTEENARSCHCTSSCQSAHCNKFCKQTHIEWEACSQACAKAGSRWTPSQQAGQMATSQPTRSCAASIDAGAPMLRISATAPLPHTTESPSPQAQSAADLPAPPLTARWACTGASGWAAGPAQAAPLQQRLLAGHHRHHQSSRGAG